MGQVRRLAEQARLYYGAPDRKRDAVARRDPLWAIAAAHSGELLWRLPDDTDWRIGAEGAAQWREDDIAQTNQTIADAGTRRRARRGGAKSQR